jgi:superoxide dismutase, Fe-Mn family
MSFVLPDLPYAKTAFPNVISSETFDYHYGKHHQAYVTNLNNLIKGTEWEKATLTDIIIKCPDTKIYNNAAQHWNHTFYWYCISPQKTAPSAELKTLLEKKWGTVDKFLDEFIAQATANFGSGWTWLVKSGGDLSIISTSNADNTLKTNYQALLTVDIWEHAYYIDYRNLRASYLQNFTKIINWDFVSQNLKTTNLELKF